MVKSNGISTNRRQFLKVVVAVAGGAWAPLGCGSSDSEGDGRQAAFFPQSVASGDPRPSSVVLWTRVVDPQRIGEDLDVTLEVAKDAQFRELVTVNGAGSLRIAAAAAADGCVKVRLTELEPDTTYYYRFVYADISSRVGRTKTAPIESSEADVRFAVVSCQDYRGKYYHVLRRLVSEELQFVVHLGDYVYESGNDSREGPRDVVFSKPDEALELGEGSDGRWAARSLDNYRDLYRTVRSDPDLQALHERAAFIVIPDDHEFADDSHGATTTHFDGRRDETDLARRRASDRAWFEYMPVDYGSGEATALDVDATFPDDFRIYRSFVFGRHLELVMTDLRRYRPDHLIPEDAFPGAVYLTAEELDEEHRAIAVPYVNIDEYADGAYAQLLRSAAEQLGYLADSVTGLLSVPWINGVLAELGDSTEPIELTEELERGLAYHLLLKSEQFSRVGSRYLVAQAPFEALAAARFRDSEGASERLMGDAQREWFLQTLRASQRTFKVWGSEIAFMQKHLDLSSFALAPPELQQRLALTAEDWDGFPNERRALLGELADVKNVVVLAGDLQCFFAGTPYDANEPSRRFVEFVIGSVSSTTWQDGLQSVVSSAGALPPSVAGIAPFVGPLLASKTPPANPHMAFQELGKNGCGVVTVSASAFDIELLMILPANVAKPASQLSGALPTLFESVRFRVPASSGDLEREATDGRAQRWSIDELAWV